MIVIAVWSITVLHRVHLTFFAVYIPYCILTLPLLLPHLKGSCRPRREGRLCSHRIQLQKEQCVLCAFTTCLQCSKPTVRSFFNAPFSFGLSTLTHILMAVLTDTLNKLLTGFQQALSLLKPASYLFKVTDKTLIKMTVNILKLELEDTIKASKSFLKLVASFANAF